ncbi:MAG: glycosyltransferase family 39 protein [Staphylococcus epidermidis]|nr:glycosyltransferase family 39 protein [Staphylococcus epidermidis]
MNNIYNKKTFYIISILSIIPFLFCLGFNTDEPFTMGLIHHGYKSIISLSRLDVHPPLYYIVLKLFLNLTTFGTKNIFIIIILSRLLSLVFSLISFVFILKTINILKIQNSYISPILYILIVGMQITNIRMYPLCLMLISIQIFYLLKLYDSDSNLYIILIFISMTLSLYSHYFSGMISGLLTILFILIFLSNKSYKKAVGLFVSGILSLTSFIPWIPSFFYQLDLQSKSANIPRLSFSTLLTNSVLPIISILILYFLVKNSSSKKLNAFLISSIVVIIIMIIILSILHINNDKYVFPILAPYTFIVISELISTEIHYKKTILTFIMFFILIGFGRQVKHEIMNIDIPSISFIKQFNAIKKDPSKNINIHKYGLNKYYWNKQYGGGGGNAIYLESIGKKIDDKNYISTYQVLGNGNVKLFKSVFPNIEHFNTLSPNNPINQKN